MTAHTPKTPKVPKKDTIYIDIDDEITAIIDKVRSSADRVVALVLPKRATMLQSIVNMKLLKRTGDEAKKQVVLITAEAGLLPLAGNVGLYVAKSLNSKPEIPHSMELSQAKDADEEEFVDMADKELDGSVPVGDYAKTVSPSAVDPDDTDEEEPIELDNTVAATETPKKPKKGAPKFKIPDFDKFRLYLVLAGGGFVVLLLLIWLAFFQLPKATIAVSTDRIAVDASADVTLKTDTQTVKTDGNIIPAQSQQTDKTSSQQVPATGQINNGEKATGTIALYNCNKDDTLSGTNRTVAAGTGVVSGGLTYITTTAVVVPPSNFAGDTCKQNKPSSGVGIVAQQPGTKYNQSSPSTYTVAGFSTMSGAGNPTAGGTDTIVKVVQQADINGAQDKLATQDASAAKLELQKALEAKGLYAVQDTFATAASDTTANAKVGDQVEAVTVTQKTTFSMLGAKKTDLQKIIGNILKNKVDKDKQKILDYGLDKATFKAESQKGNETLVALQTTAIAGSDLNLADIKQQVAGKKAADAKEIISKNPGVTDVKVSYSPFWVSSIPKKASKITISVEQPRSTKNAQ